MASDKTFFLEIVSPEGKILGEDVEFCVLPGYEGQLGILPNHAPLVSMLGPGEIKIEKNGKASYFAVSGGFMEVSSNKVTVAADTCEAANDIDRQQALAAKNAAMEELLKATDSQFVAQARTKLKIAEIRLKIAEKAGGGDQGK